MARDGEWSIYVSDNPRHFGVWKIRPNGSDAANLAPGAFNLAEVSPDGRYALFIEAQYAALQTVIRVVEVESGRRVPFEIVVPHAFGLASGIWGRARWTPDSRAIAFVGTDAAGRAGVFVQDFEPGRDTAASRRPLAGLQLGRPTESFGISPDGTCIVLSLLEQTASVMLADAVPGVEPPVRRR